MDEQTDRGMMWIDGGYSYLMAKEPLELFKIK